MARRATSTGFIALLEEIVVTYPDAPAVAIMVDNVIIHSSKVVRAWLRHHPQVRLLYGARYSPHQNPVERVWGALKRHLANSPAPTMAGRLIQMRAFFNSRSDDEMLATASPEQAIWMPRRYGQNLRRAA